MIKYLYALDNDGKSICISDLNEKNRKYSEFRCICCGDKLIPRLGEIKKHHFAHKSELNCSYETYLHKLGKIMFMNEYQYCLNNNSPFWIDYVEENYCVSCHDNYGRQCFLDSQTKKFDLTKTHKIILMEQKNGDFIPDLTLKSSKQENDIFVEIAVTHKSEHKKLTSGIRIIELNIKHEDDLIFLKDHDLKAENTLLKFINFRTSLKKIKKFTLYSNCPKYFHYIIYYKTGKTYLGLKKYYEIPKELSRYDTIHSTLIDDEVTDSDKIKNSKEYDLLKKLFISGKKIKHCSICRYSAKRHTWDINFWCKFLRKHCIGSDALKCGYHRCKIDFYQEATSKNKYYQQSSRSM